MCGIASFTSPLIAVLPGNCEQNKAIHSSSYMSIILLDERQDLYLSPIILHEYCISLCSLVWVLCPESGRTHTLNMYIAYINKPTIIKKDLPIGPHNLWLPDDGTRKWSVMYLVCCLKSVRFHFGPHFLYNLGHILAYILVCSFVTIFKISLIRDRDCNSQQGIK